MILSKENIQSVDANNFISVPSSINSFIIVYARRDLSDIVTYEDNQHDYRRDIRHTFYANWYGITMQDVIETTPEMII